MWFIWKRVLKKKRPVPYVNTDRAASITSMDKIRQE